MTERAEHIHNGSFVLFLETVSLCIPRCPETHSGDHAGLELIEISLPLLLKSWDLKVCDSRHK